jgi:CO/xanthine dehydrogenase Mo-binding subunit
VVARSDFPHPRPPVNADVQDIEVIFVEEHDEVVNPLGIKGLGEPGLVGVAAAIANAVFHATGSSGYRVLLALPRQRVSTSECARLASIGNH